MGLIKPKKKCKNFIICKGWIIGKTQNKFLCDKCGATINYYRCFSCKHHEDIPKGTKTTAKECPQCHIRMHKLSRQILTKLGKKGKGILRPNSFTDGSYAGRND